MTLTAQVILIAVDVIGESSLRTTTLVPSLALASSNWYCGTALGFAGKVYITLDIPLGTESPFEFSALTTNM